MSTRLKYKTRQKEMLIDYLSSVEGEHITANDVCEFFKSQGETIGQSTIYRHLESLVDEGIINKYVIDANSPACFEYMGRESHLAGEVCFHCKCEKCGCLIHLHCDELSEIGKHLYNEHDVIAF